MAVAVGDTAPDAASGGCDALHDAVHSIPSNFIRYLMTMKKIDIAAIEAARRS